MESRKTMEYGENPHYPETYEEQLKALESDPQMEWFRAAREAGKSDRYRPVYHLIRPEGCINDPNGLCFWEGRWHLFYQANDSRIHWGHAVSEDLLRWRDLPFAIYPKLEDHCFSGGTCVDVKHHRVIAAYYGFTGYWSDDSWRVGTVIATSSDPLLLNWTKVNDGAPVIPDRDAPCWKADDAPAVPNQKPYKVFDSNIWMEGDTYYLVTGGYSHHPVTNRRFREMYLFRCTDENLTNWEFVGPFLGKHDRFREVGDDGACPYFTKLGDRYLLSHFSHRRLAKWLLGDYDPETHEFVPVNGGRYVSAHNIMVAPCVCALPDEDGAAVAVFNTCEQVRQKDWHGTMTLPRKLTVGGRWHDELNIAPGVDLTPLRENHKTVENLELKNAETVVLDGINGTAYEAIITLPAGSIPQTLEIELLRSPDAEERTVFSFLYRAGGDYAIQPYNEDSVMMLNTRYSSKNTDARVLPPDTAQAVIDEKEDVTLHVFVDKSSVEVFANDRAVVFGRVYPTRDDSTGIALRALGTDGTVAKLDYWDIKSIY